MPDVFVSEIEAITQQALRAHGANDTVACEMARAVAWAEARRNRICGLYYVESYCQQLVTGRVDGQAVPVVSRPRPGVVAVDAANGFAQPAFALALAEAVAAAKEQGIVSVPISRAHTCTALGYFTEMAAREGVLCFGATNASPIVAPPGGKTRVEGWAVDANGAPTTDPDAAIKGSLTSLGGLDQGYKGWGFGLMAELLASGMTGGRVSRNVKPLKAPEGDPHELGQYFILIDPEGSGAFFARLAEVQAGVALDEGARMPGAHKQLTDPIDVPQPLWDLMLRLASGPGGAHA